MSIVTIYKNAYENGKLDAVSIIEIMKGEEAHEPEEIEQMLIFLEGKGYKREEIADEVADRS